MKKNKLIPIIIAVLLLNTVFLVLIFKDHSVTIKEIKQDMNYVSGSSGIAAEQLKEEKKSETVGDDFITTAIGKKISASRSSSSGNPNYVIAKEKKNKSAEKSELENKTEVSIPQMKPLKENEPGTIPFDIENPESFESGDVEYADNQLLIKFKKSFNGKVSPELRSAGIGKLEPMFTTEDGAWFVAYLHKRADVNETLESVRTMKSVVVAEYNFKSEASSIDTDPISNTVKSNELVDQQWVLKSCGIQASWNALEADGINPGGSRNVTVAVIDTGVDYNHKDLDKNIWTNNDEIPDNDIDDDGNGYVDDYYGIDMTAKSGSGMDDQGHGTHVAGIIAAENNNIGVVGIAYNTKVMPVKAGDASGHFLQSNIAESIIYAYSEGADVINMSFGGSASSVAVRDALATAYSRCVLVAAAGNDGSPNGPTEYYKPLPSYPGNYKFVLGVMSSDRNDIESNFTNWDAYRFNNNEYEVYAPGNNILSTIPHDRYASLSGTSMASPIVAAQAALLRSVFNDMNTYPTKFIYGQISGASDETITCCRPDRHTVSGVVHEMPGRINVERSLADMPKPEISISEYTVFDSVGFENDTEGIAAEAAEANNGDGIIDSGEVIALGLTLRNRWGMSKDSIVSLDATNDLGVTNPYVTFLNNDINYGSIGTYSDQDAGRIIENDEWTGWENPFYLKIEDNCPNNYTITINVSITSRNGLDESDSKEYTKTDSLELKIRNGVILPNKITEDMTLTSDNYYIIPNSTIIMEGATVSVEAGTQIQFWTNDPKDAYADNAITYLKVQGKLLCNGTDDSPVEIFPSDWMDKYRVEIYTSGNGYIGMDHTHITNPHITVNRANNCVFDRVYPNEYMWYRVLAGGNVVDDYREPIIIAIEKATECVFYKLSPGFKPYYAKGNNYDSCMFVDSALVIDNNIALNKCVFYGNNTYEDGSTGFTNSSYSAKINNNLHISISDIVRNPDEDHYYASIPFPSTVKRKDFFSTYSNQFDFIVNNFSKKMNGSLAGINSKEEIEFLAGNIAKSGTTDYWCGIHRGKGESVRNYDGSIVPDNISVEAGSLVSGVLNNGIISFSNQSSSTSNSYLIEIPGDGLATDIEFDQYVLKLESGQSAELNARIKPLTLSQSDLIYTSDDESVATVDTDGTVTAVAPGTTQIKAYSQDLAIYNYVTVNVSDFIALEHLGVAEDEMQVSIGNTKRIKPVFTPDNTTRTTVSYSSSDDSIASVTANGVVTANKVGNAVITVTGDNGLTATVNVHAVVPIESISFSRDVYETYINGEGDETVTEPEILPADATNKKLIWDSSNPDVCSVVDGHLVKTSTGIATIKATAEHSDVSGEITVIVTDSEVISTAVKNVRTDTFGNTYAITEAGEVYIWGNGILTPRKMSFENVEDAIIRNGDPGAIYILDKNGNVSKYSWSIDDPVKDEEFGTLRNIRSLSESHYNYSSVHVIDNDGVVWAFGGGGLGDGSSSSRETPVEIYFDNEIVKVLDLQYAAVYLDSLGNAYVSGGYRNNCRYTPELIQTGVRDIYSMGRSHYFSCELSNDTIESYSSETLSRVGSVVSVDHSGMHFVSKSDFYVYLEDGIPYVKGDNKHGQLGIGSTNNISSYTPMNGVTNVKEVITTGKDDIYGGYISTFIITDDGELYGTGYNKNAELGIGNKENISTPSHISLNPKDYSEEPIVMTDWSGASGTVTSDGTVEVKFNTSIMQGADFSTISLKDADGNSISNKKSIESYKLTIKPKGDLVEGQTYTIRIPKTAVMNNLEQHLNEELVLSFEYQKSNSENDSIEETQTHDAVIDEDIIAQRKTVTSDALIEAWEEYCGLNINANFYSNVILNRINDDDVNGWLRITAPDSDNYTTIKLGHNYWGTTKESLINRQILDFDDFQSLADINESDYLTEPPSDTFPFVTEAYLTVNGGKVDTVSNEEVTFVVDFNRPMDTSIDLDVKFGSSYPYADYTISGEYITDTEWQGTVKLTTLIENGYQCFSISNGKAAGTSLKLYKDWGRFPFLIDTASAQSLLMQGTATEDGIDLTWSQDDFETLAGYNVYRSTSEDGLYSRVNTTLIPADTKEFLDDTVAPGVDYYYNFTVVQTDLTESEPSGKVQVTSLDTMAPNIYHTPVTTAFKGNNLVVSATIIDNVAIENASLYYRVAGNDNWNSLVMDRNNDKYSAVINSSFITDDGLEYFIEAFDGHEYTYKGSEEEPFFVTVQDTISASDLGDVDGNGIVELKDAMMLLMAVNDRLNLTEEEFMRADLDGNGELSAKEALRIIYYINGIISSLL